MTFGIDKLITSLKAGRSYDQLSKDCGGIPTASRLSAMAHGNIGAFPAVETVQGISQGLGVPPEEVVAACGVTLGLWGDGKLGAPIPLPAGTDKLYPEQKSVVVSVIRQFVKDNER